MIKSDVRYHIGETIREIRERKGETLKSVAQAVGVSESLLSQIERNRVSPSLDTLISIADVLEIDPDYLFKDFKRSKEITLVHRGKGKRLVLQKAVYEACAPHILHAGADSVEVVFIDLPPGGEKGNSEFGHQGTETGIILSGEGSLTYGATTYSLTKGDSVSFPSDMPHILKNTGTDNLEGLWLISPPRIFIAKT
ncbi:MAG TPA: XRE family transcriptional regulator [Spirochaetia bacterium]|nr:XRE family transcriptional regulator [Spirochaetia bacterium]